jgi:hypothetical protein
MKYLLFVIPVALIIYGLTALISPETAAEPTFDERLKYMSLDLSDSYLAAIRCGGCLALIGGIALSVLLAYWLFP